MQKTILAVTLCFVSILAPAMTVWADSVNVWTVAPVAITGEFSPVQVDSSGQAHIAIYDGVGQCLKYAFGSGSSWSFQTIDSCCGVGRDAALSIEPNGRTDIVYCDGANDDLKQAWSTGSGWNVGTIPGSQDCSFSGGLCDDPVRGVLMMALFGNTSALNHLMLLWQQSGYAWAGPETVDPTNGMGVTSSLAFDPRGNPQVAYTSSDGILRVAYISNGSWSQYSFSSPIHATGRVQMALDSQTGDPRIAYYDPTGGGSINVACYDNGSWQVTPITTTNASQNFSMAYDPCTDGYAVCYWDQTDGTLRVAGRTGYNGMYSNFDMLVDGGITGGVKDDVGLNPYITLVADNEYMVSYDDSTGGLLKVAEITKDSPLAPVPEPSGFLILFSGAAVALAVCQRAKRN
jgi:hypothetical protein